MAEKKGGGLRGWLRNVWKAPGHTLQAGLEAGSDVVNTTTGFFQDILNSCRATKDKIVDLFSQDKKWYQKLLNVPIAGVVGLSGIVEAAVKPVVKGAINVGKTTVKVPINAGKVVGSVLTSEPKNLSFDTLKTKKKEYKISTAGPGTGVEWLDKRVLNTGKSWFDGRGKRTGSKNKEAAAAATAAATAAAVSAEVAKVTKTFEQKLKDVEDACKKQIEEVLDKNKKLDEQNKKLIEDNKNKDGEIAKLKAEIEGLKKSGTKPAEKSAEKKGDGGKPEKKEEKSESKEIKDEKRVPEIVKSSKSKKMLSYSQRTHPEIKIETDDTTGKGKLLGSKSGSKIIVGTKDIENAEHILDHEIAHEMLQDNVAGMQELKDAVKKMNEKYGKQLSSVANNDDEYDTKEKKTIEDVCEIIAFYARDDGSFEKHMKKLQSGENNTLAQINESDAEHLKSLCENIFSKLNVVKLYEDAPVSAAA